jgi:tRNA (adenine22-N1)-methyltransferase
MGADTMISILEAAPWLRSNRYRMILQCQSKRPQLRRYLYENGWRINRETLVKEGKFYYPITEVVYDPGHSLTPGGYYITPALLRSGSPLLPDFLERVITGLQCSVDGMAQTGGKKYEELKTVLTELQQFQ